VSGRHDILIAEDDAECAQAMVDLVRAMEMDCRVVRTLEEEKAALAERLPCAIVQDMQMPYAAGAQPHEKSGESAMRNARALSNGARRVPIVVVTAFRSDPDYVWAMSELEAEGFIAKSNLGALADKLAGALKKRGREDHARCAECNEESRVERASLAKGPPATLFAHDRRAVVIDAAEVAALGLRRRELDLFLDYATEDPRGWLAGYRDHAGAFHETRLGETSAAILAELVEARKPLRPDALKRLRGGGRESAVRLVQKARQAVDVRKIVRGKESRTEWRAFHTRGSKVAMEFEFQPPVGMTYAVMVRGKG
jgi:CheY-like chemotaxis protein